MPLEFIKHFRTYVDTSSYASSSYPVYEAYFKYIVYINGSVVECLTRDRGVADLSLAGVIALCPCARHINPCLVLVQPRKTCPDITEKLLTRAKIIK